MSNHFWRLLIAVSLVGVLLGFMGGNQVVLAVSSFALGGGFVVLDAGRVKDSTGRHTSVEPMRNT